MSDDSQGPTIALLDCGHWFREWRPEGLAKPKQGELRACGHPEHYPNQYPATYVVKAPDDDVPVQTMKRPTESNDLAERVAKLRTQGPDYAQWSWENEDREKPDDGRGWVERELTGNQRITCSCGFGTGWVPREEAVQQAREHIHGEHPDWAGTPAWIV